MQDEDYKKGNVEISGIMVFQKWHHVCECTEASDSEYEISVGQQIYQLGKGEEHKIVSKRQDEI